MQKIKTSAALWLALLPAMAGTRAASSDAASGLSGNSTMIDGDEWS